MARLAFDIETELPPEPILAALTDFTERRPDLWPGLKREAYEVYEVGETWAEVREGSGGPVWARERYDWSRPGNVTWTVQESGFSTTGDSVSADVTARPGGGSRIHVVWSRRGKSLPAKLIVALITLTRGAPVRLSIQSGLRRIAESEATKRVPP